MTNYPRTEPRFIRGQCVYFVVHNDSELAHLGQLLDHHTQPQGVDTAIEAYGHAPDHRKDCIMKRPLTEAQTAARDARRAKFRTLAQGLAAMSETERAALAGRMAGAVTVEGRQLSVHNACLLACQAPNATLIGGFRQWLAAGRQVRKGEHGMMIWAPCKGATDPNLQPGELTTERQNFIMVTVFDVSQTDAIGQEATEPNPWKQPGVPLPGDIGTMGHLTGDL